MWDARVNESEGSVCEGVNTHSDNETHDHQNEEHSNCINLHEHTDIPDSGHPKHNNHDYDACVGVRKLGEVNSCIYGSVTFCDSQNNRIEILREQLEIENNRDAQIQDEKNHA